MGFNGRPGRQKRQRNREMFDLWAGSGLTFREIGTRYGLSANRARVIVVNQMKRDRMEAEERKAGQDGAGEEKRGRAGETGQGGEGEDGHGRDGQDGAGQDGDGQDGTGQEGRNDVQGTD